MAYCPLISTKSIALVSINEGGGCSIDERFLSFDCPENTNCKLWNDDTKNCDLSYSSQKTDVEKKEKEDEDKKKKDEKAIPEIPYYVNLVAEFFGNEDRDKNKKIYGKDFKIADDDEKPIALRGLEEHPDWIEPEETMTWKEYIESMKDVVEVPPRDVETDPDEGDPDPDPNPDDVCDKDHLDLCLNESDCTGASGFWYDNKCNKDKKSEICSESNLSACTNELDCLNLAGGLWLNRVCIPFPPGGIRCDKDHLNICYTRADCNKYGGFWYKKLGAWGSITPDACYKESQKYKMFRVIGGNPITWYGKGTQYRSKVFKISEIEIYTGSNFSGKDLCKGIKYSKIICSTESVHVNVQNGVSDFGGFKENAVDGDKNTAWKTTDSDYESWWGILTDPIDSPRSFKIRSLGITLPNQGPPGVYIPKTIKLQGAAEQGIDVALWVDLSDEFPTEDTTEMQEFTW